MAQAAARPRRYLPDSPDPVAVPIRHSTFVMKELAEHYTALVSLGSIEAVTATALDRMHRHGSGRDTTAAIYLAARMVLVNRIPGRLKKEKRFIDSVFEICPLALPNIRVIAHMLILQNDDEDHYGYVEELARYICSKGAVPFQFPMFRFKLHALRLQAETTHKQYDAMFSDRDMAPAMLFVSEMIEKLEDRQILVIDDEERYRANEIIDEVYEEMGRAHLMYDPLFGRIFYDPEGAMEEHSGKGAAEAGAGPGAAAAATGHHNIDWYDTIALRYARPATSLHIRKRPRPSPVAKS